jgi:DNA mismatch repair protein MLH3
MADCARMESTLICASDTSKFPSNPCLHGGTGAFLASLAALSLLSITSHGCGFHSHNSIKIQDSEVLARHTPAPPDMRILTFNHGTRATIHNLFGSMPVRVKQRPVAVDKASSGREWGRLKTAVVALLLAWPGHVAVSIRDTASQECLVIRNSDFSDRSRSERELRSGLVSHVCKTFCQAGFSDESSIDAWVPLRASTSNLSISGAVCVIPVATKRMQFISIGITPVPNERGPNVLYEEINRMFANSSFGVEEAIENGEAERRGRTADRQYETKNFTNRQLAGRKGIDRWPMFYVKICSAEDDGKWGHDMEAILNDREYKLDVIIDVVRVMILEFLKKHLFRPRCGTHRRRYSSQISDIHGTSNDPKSYPPAMTSRHLAGRKDEANYGQTANLIAPVGDLAITQLRVFCESPSLRRSESPFDGWRRVKCGRPRLPLKQGKNVHESTGKDQGEGIISKRSETPPPQLDTDGSLLRVPFLDVDDPQASRELAQNMDAGADVVGNNLSQSEELNWIDPVTKETLFVDPRTGFVVEKLEENGDRSSIVQPGRLTSCKRPRLQAKPPNEDPSSWLKELLTSWTNPVFEMAEPLIPVAYDERGSVNSTASAGCRGCHLSTAKGTSELSPVFESRLTKDALRNAEVIAQVDRKFVLAKLFPNLGSDDQVKCNEVDDSILVIVDQHAADERCRVEILLRGFFEPCESTTGLLGKANTEILDKALQYEISAQEHGLFERFVSHFEVWGIEYQLSTNTPSLRGKGIVTSSMKILGLPPSIAERCRLEPRLLIELLRKEAWKLDERGRIHSEGPRLNNEAARKITEKELHWLSRFHGCPQGILDMINSRACRSAIMFNDMLSPTECKNLLRRLADCTLPFQCAHGRPSMVPLVNFSDKRMGRGVNVDETSFGQQFKRWKTYREQESL